VTLGYHLFFTASEVRARCTAGHQSALAVWAIAEESNFGRKQLLLHILVTESTKSSTAPRIHSADVGETGTVDSAARNVNNFLPENFTRLVHHKRVHEIESDFTSGFNTLACFAEASLAIFFAAT
jgi:hypothetical protein